MRSHGPARRRARRRPAAIHRQDRPAAGATLTLPRVRPGDPAGRAVSASFEAALARIHHSEFDARRGDDEGIHRLRTATRRLRSELRAFRELADPQWMGRLERELKWLAGLLGAVRDLDVLTGRLEEAAASQGESSDGALAPVFDELAARHARASCALRDALRGERYGELLAALAMAIEHPALKDEARAPCRTALPPLAAAAWRRLRKPARALRPDDPDEAFHEVRKRAKRARYTAEMVEPALGGSAARGARRFIRAATRVQDVLGAHQDAVVAAHFIADILADRADDAAFARAAHRLLDGQTEAADASRRDFFRARDKLDRRRCRRWLKVAAKAGSRS